MTYKKIKDLAPGDIIRTEMPPSRARIIKVEASEMTKICPHGQEEWQGQNVLALIVDFEFLEGKYRGRREYVFQHPDDHVFLG